MSDNTTPTPTEILLVADNLEDARVTIQSLKQDDIQWRVSLVDDDEGGMPCGNRQGVFSKAPLPDLILLDMDLPDNDGRQVLAGIQADWQLRGIPIVVLTGSLLQEAVRETENLQVAGFMTRPLNSGQFNNVLRSIRQSRVADLAVPPLGWSNLPSGNGDGIAQQPQLLAALASSGVG